MILALKKEWRFQTSEKIEKDKRVFNSKIRYFKDLYLETREPHEEIINKFRNDCIKSYTKDIIDEYEIILREQLKSL